MFVINFVNCISYLFILDTTGKGIYVVNDPIIIRP